MGILVFKDGRWPAITLRYTQVFIWCLISSKGPSVCQENTPHTITTPAPAWCSTEIKQNLYRKQSMIWSHEKIINKFNECCFCAMMSPNIWLKHLEQTGHWLLSEEQSHHCLCPWGNVAMRCGWQLWLGAWMTKSSHKISGYRDTEWEGRRLNLCERLRGTSYT